MKTGIQAVRQAADEVGLTLAEDGVECVSHVPALAASAVASGLRQDWPLLAVFVLWTTVVGASMTAAGIHLVGVVFAIVTTSLLLSKWLWRRSSCRGWTPGVVRVGNVLYVP